MSKYAFFSNCQVLNIGNSENLLNDQHDIRIDSAED